MAIKSMILRIEDCLLVGVWLDFIEVDGILHIGHQPGGGPAIFPVIRLHAAKHNGSPYSSCIFAGENGLLVPLNKKGPPKRPYWLV